jgi:hypothetical protein
VDCFYAPVCENMKGLVFLAWAHNKVWGRLGDGGDRFFILDQIFKLNLFDLVELSKGLHFTL